MANLFKSPFYFLFCASFGFVAWLFSFNSDLNDLNYFSKNALQESQFSSRSPQQYGNFDNEELTDSMRAQLELVKDDILLNELVLTDDEWLQKSDEPYSTSPAEVEEYEEIMNNSYGELKDHRSFMEIEADAPQIQYEDENKCGPSRLTIDQILKKSPGISDLILEKESNESVMPKKCLTHVMNVFNMPDRSRGSCPRSAKYGLGKPIRKYPKPCVSKTMVNVTYNSFIDVTSCMGINPKSLIPKLSNESGMLINTLGGGFDAGIGQLTKVAIEETNKYYDSLMQEIKMQAATKPSCARILKYKSLLNKVSADPMKRCELIAAPENPLKNILYMAMLNRINTNSVRRRFENTDIQSKVKKLGLANADMNMLVETISLLSYNAGPSTAFNALNRYLDKRIKAGKKLSSSDFDFYNPKTVRDIDGQVKSVTEIARAYVNAPYIRKSDPNLKIKLMRAKLLPEKIRSSYALTFPEFLIYSQNNFDENQKTVTKKYRTIGTPGYLGFLADKNRALRETFAETSAGANYCSDPNFLKMN
jgi:hypothetical protein